MVNYSDVTDERNNGEKKVKEAIGITVPFEKYVQ